MENVSSTDVYRDSLHSAVLDKVQSRLEEITRMKREEINALRIIEQQLNDGTQKIDGLITAIHNQQRLIEVTTNDRDFPSRRFDFV